MRVAGEDCLLQAIETKVTFAAIVRARKYESGVGSGIDRVTNRAEEFIIRRKRHEAQRNVRWAGERNL